MHARMCPGALCAYTRARNDLNMFIITLQQLPTISSNERRQRTRMHIFPAEIDI
jgi:hypothetical protein